MTTDMDARKDRTALRLKLFQNGFDPLPNKNKLSLLKNWSRVEITANMISNEWTVSPYARLKDTGIRCGNVVALDFDIDDPDLLNDFLDRVVGDGIIDESDFVRIGRPPREMWIYATRSPLSKRTTGGFGNATTKKAQVEVLGIGSQFGAYGAHSPEHDYAWPVKSLLDHDITELPEITSAQIERLIEAAIAFFEERGLARLDVGGGGTPEGGYTRSYDLTRDMVFPTSELGTATVDQLEDFLLEQPHVMLRCTMEALRPSTGGSMAGMVSMVHGLICISDHGTYITHYLAEADPTDKMAKLSALLAKKFPPAPVVKITDLSMDPRKSFDDNLDIALQRYAYVMADDRVLDIYANTDGYPVPHFKNLMLPFFYVEEGDRGGEHITRLSDAWLQNPDRINVGTASMRPDQPYPFYTVDGVEHANTYRPHILPDHGDPSVGIDFMERLIPDKAERDYVMQWLGYKLLNPGVRGPAIVMVANQTYGTGRGSFISLLTDMFQERYVASIDFNTLTGKTYQAQYNEWLADNLLVTVNEASENNSNSSASRWEVKHDAYEHLKQIVDPGESRILVNRKRLSNMKSRTFASVLVMTNHADALVIPSDDRRFMMISNGDPQTPEYWLAFHAWRSDMSNVGAFVHYLKNVDLTGYNPFAAPPMTAAKAEMISASTSELDRAVESVLADMPGWAAVKDQVILRIEKYLTENAVTFPTEWKRGAEKVFTRLTRRPVDTPERMRVDGKQHSVRLLARPVDAELLKNPEVVLEEVAKNGPTIRQISGMGVVPFRKPL